MSGGDGEVAGVRILVWAGSESRHIASIMTQPDIDGALVGLGRLAAGELEKNMPGYVTLARQVPAADYPMDERW